jgi:hypothetical protein
MSKKVLSMLVGLVFALSLTAGSAQANGNDREKIVFAAANIGGAECEDALFGLSFDMVSPDGLFLGTGTACIHSIEGCEPFVAGCHQVVRATWTLNFDRGSLTVPMKLREIWQMESRFKQRGGGSISGATGDFAGADGNVKGGGTADFATGAIDLVYVVRLRGDLEDED